MRNSRADVVAAALRVLDEHGLEHCSMRRVAAELGVQPGALYHHVENKQTLLALMADEIVAPVVAGAQEGVSAPAHATASARALCVAVREAMLAVNDGADVVAAASAFRLGRSELEQRLAELVGADAARTLLLYTYGHTQSTQMHRQAVAVGALVARTNEAVAPRGGSSSAVNTTPELDPEASFARGIDIILAGYASTV